MRAPTQALFYFIPVSRTFPPWISRDVWNVLTGNFYNLWDEYWPLILVLRRCGGVLEWSTSLESAGNLRWTPLSRCSVAWRPGVAYGNGGSARSWTGPPWWKKGKVLCWCVAKCSHSSGQTSTGQRYGKPVPDTGEWRRLSGVKKPETKQNRGPNAIATFCLRSYFSCKKNSILSDNFEFQVHWSMIATKFIQFTQFLNWWVEETLCVA